MRMVRGLLLFALFVSVAVSARAEKALTNDDVVKLVKLGIGDEAVIAKIRQASAVDFKLETDDLGTLKTAGVGGKVIAAMLDRSSGAVVGGVVTPESVHALVGARPGAPASAQVPTLEGKDGTKPIAWHMGTFHQSGFAGFGATFSVFEGARCSVRTRDRRPTVVFANDVTPQEHVFLVRLESDPKDNDRNLKIGSFLKGGNPFSDKSDAKPDPDWRIAYDAMENPAGVWHITPKLDLSAGEYGVYTGKFMFDFGVD